VPENYDDPGSRQIRLHVAIIKSSSDKPAPDSLIILYGGPGAYALDRLDVTIQRFAGVLTARDIILFDQRGTGYSQPSLNCPELDYFNLEVIDEQLNHEQEFLRRLAIYRTCRERLQAEGVSLQAYSATAIARDVASLREALGYDSWNLYGVSYGARLALMVMRDFPGGLRTAILDSAYPLNIDLAAETAEMHNHSLATLFAATSEKHPQFEEAFFALVDQLDASPITVTAPDPRSPILHSVQTFSGVDLLRLTVNLVRWPQSLPHLPGLVEDVAAVNYNDLSYFLQKPVGDQLFSEGMNLSVNCQEIDPATQFPRENGFSAIDPRVYDLATVDVQQRVELCKVWLGEDWPVARQAPVVSDIPTLLLRGEHEAVIPPQWSEQAAAGLSDSIALTFPGAGHGVITSSTCAQETIAAFLNKPSKTPTVTCQK
jgi:pimeloyl-ACP methyl ester carboxylesterase